MESAAPCQALVVDDGELDDVRELLGALGIAWAEARSFDAPEAPARISLLVTNARHALDSEGMRPAAVTHVVVYKEVSRTLRKVLERSGCDVVLQRPVNPSSFRVLARHALYTGPERRRARRVVLSERVRVEAGGKSLRATLEQLSLRGCGLRLEAAPRLGSELCVSLPRELTGGEALELRGPVLAVRPAPEQTGTFEVSMAFRLADAESRRCVTSIMDRHAGASQLRPHPVERAATRAAPPEPAADPVDRRSGPRRSYTRPVLAAGAGICHALIGRDLSSGGMRVRPDPDLALGDELRIAVHARAGQPAIMLRAVVSRDDGDDGLLLRFHDVPASIARRLEQIVGELPQLGPGGRGGAGPGLVVSEVLDRD
jgi:hypothetical protein